MKMKLKNENEHKGAGIRSPVCRPGLLQILVRPPAIKKNKPLEKNKFHLYVILVVLPIQFPLALPMCFSSSIAFFLILHLSLYFTNFPLFPIMTCAWPCMTFAWPMHELAWPCTTCAWPVHDLCMTRAWPAHDLRMTLHNLCMTCAWPAHDLAWHVHDLCMTCE